MTHRTLLGVLAVIAFALTSLSDDAFARGKGRGSGYGGGSHSGGGHVDVKPHFRKDGTYVRPHRRTAPNSTQRDNFESKPNVNPYTGQPGTKEPQH